MRIFEHTSRERGLWRGWLRSGQSLELSRGRTGWEFGAGILIHSNELDNGDRMICLKFWRFAAFIPLGIIKKHFSVGDEPQWSVFASSEFGLTFHWDGRRKHFYWPWDYDWHRTSYMMADGSWLHDRRSERPGVNRKSRFATNHDHWEYIYRQRQEHAWRETHPYSYTLKSGEVQNVMAGITMEERECRRRFLRWTRVGAMVSRSIGVEFSDEVGEEAGSWKGGTVGCNYTMLPGETAEDALRRMERERKF